MFESWKVIENQIKILEEKLAAEESLEDQQIYRDQLIRLLELYRKV